MVACARSDPETTLTRVMMAETSLLLVNPLLSSRLPTVDVTGANVVPRQAAFWPADHAFPQTVHCRPAVAAGKAGCFVQHGPSFCRIPRRRMFGRGPSRGQPGAVATPGGAVAAALAFSTPEGRRNQGGDGPLAPATTGGRRCS